MRRKIWSGIAWDEYLYWQTQDKKTLKRINAMIKYIEQGTGKPEALTGNYLGWYSRRIDEKNRLIYRILDDDSIEISQCRSHYGDK